MNARFDKALDTIKKKEKWFMASEGSKTLSTFLLTLLPARGMDKPRSCDGPRLHDGTALNRDFLKSISRSISDVMSVDDDVISTPLFL